MSTEKRLKEIRPKIERAKIHVANLKREIHDFLEKKPYKVGVKSSVYYVTSVEPTPISLALIAGDAIQNLMSALDHLAYQLVCSDTGDQPPKPSRIYFPIAEDVSQYESRKQERMAGARQETLCGIDALKPYKGGNDFLWTLHRLNNIDKHRILLTVGSQAGGVHLGQLFAHLFAGDKANPVFSHPDMVKGFESMDIFLNPADKGFPLKPGFELYKGPGHPNQKFRFEVAFNEPGVIEGKPLIETMYKLTEVVESVVKDLTPRLN